MFTAIFVAILTAIFYSYFYGYFYGLFLQSCFYSLFLQSCFYKESALIFTPRPGARSAQGGVYRTRNIPI